ncbi:MAG: bifunctional 2-polyprenyl-6-hydroxyphenol methylase/3-demethylubiquinol 3-O-methyltransferase UbiG [Hyphomicrobium sp.]
MPTEEHHAHHAASAAPNLDPAEVERFERLAGEWWDTSGKLRPLHSQGPARLSFIRDALVRHFDRSAGTLKPLSGLSVLDVGCGGGLVSEPLARLGATVTGIDPTHDSIAVARRHAQAQGLSIDYRTASVEELEAKGEHFDAVVCMEVIEHVPDQAAFVKSLGRLVRPGGAIVMSTLNRTLKCYALAIVGAEYILGWLPRGTHDWNRFVTTDELSRYLAASGFSAPELSGIVYDVISDTWRLGSDTDVNYIASAVRRTD